ncbi:MAG: response regulator, partial [Gammaproteobacteria bacterium]|nr:response regulator [Gammaproteobacteria bacterium]
MSNKHVLVVEDDVDIREMLAFSLEKAGYAVVQTEDAELALEKLGTLLPDIMLVDWMLPGMNGPDFVRR